MNAVMPERSFQASICAEQHCLSADFPCWGAVCGNKIDPLGEVKMERAFATLSAGLLIVWTLAVITSVSLGGHILEIFQPAVFLFLVLPSVFPTISVFGWLLVERKPTTLKLAGIIGAAVAISILSLAWVYLDTNDLLARTLIPFISIPVGGGIVFACLAYFIGAKLPEAREKS